MNERGRKVLTLIPLNLDGHLFSGTGLVERPRRFGNGWRQISQVGKPTTGNSRCR
jgi:hypothetical protein